MLLLITPARNGIPQDQKAKKKTSARQFDGSENEGVK